jgi:hypothetical protein
VNALRIGLAVVFAAGFFRDDPRAAQILAEVREGLGGEARLGRVQSLSVRGSSLRPMPDGNHVVELAIDLQFPDKLLRTDTESGHGGGAQFVMLRGVNGPALLRNSKIVNGGPGSRMSKPPLIGGTEAVAVASARHELARFALALLMTAPSASQIEFTYAGEAESPDGRADVLDLKGADGFAAKLFIDKSSHRPLMLTYRDFDPRFMIPPKKGALPGVAISDETTLKEITWFLDDYGAESRLQMPHRISRAIDADADEEWAFKTIVVNPVFKVGAFSDQ